MSREWCCVLLLFVGLVGTRTTAAQRTNIAPATCSAASSPAQAHKRVISLEYTGNTVRFAEWPVSLGARRVPARVIVVRFRPRDVRVELEINREGSTLVPWQVSMAPGDALVALNAGQFTDAGPWGWVVHNGREWQAPGTGDLAGALVADTSGTIHIVSSSDIRHWRNSGMVREAVQSYPVLLEGKGSVPPALCRADAINREHRDTRLAIGTDASGEVIIAMTRYDGAGAAGERLPIGPTTPEMVMVMSRLGAVRAVMLDGGLSAQMLVRNGTRTLSYSGLRGVPLALVVR